MKSKFLIGDIAEINAESLKKNHSLSSIKYLDTSSVTENRFDEAEILEVTKAPSRAKRIVRDKDIIISTVRPNLKHFGFIEKPDDNLIVSTGFAVIRCNHNIVEPRYLYFYLSLNKTTDYLAIIAEGSTTTYPSIKPSVIADMEVELPSLPTQKKIAHILSTLDDKIELNRKMNQTLEQMAQALFKSWFVDFDPVKAKAKCSSDEELEAVAKELGISKEILELFPSEFEDSELGMIPKGWRVESLSNHISITKGKSYKSSELKESNTALVTLKSFLRGGGYRTDGIKPYIGKYKDEQVVEPGELIMAYTDVTQAADVIGKPAIVLKNPSMDTLVASLDVGIVRVKSQLVNIMYLYQLFKTKKFQGYILGHTSGTTVLHLAKGWFELYRILLPKKEIMSEFNKITAPLFNKIQINIEQEQTLQKTRDTLLPKLLSGEIEV